MKKIGLLLAIMAASSTIYADENPVDVALKKLDADIAKFQQDLSKNADKLTLSIDKRNIKADQTAVKAARRNEMDWYAKHQPSSD